MVSSREGKLDIIKPRRKRETIAGTPLQRVSIAAAAVLVVSVIASFNQSLRPFDQPCSPRGRGDCFFATVRPMTQHLRFQLFRLSWILTFAFFFSMQAGIAAPAPRNLPEFEIKLLDGTVVSNKKLLGKVAVIDFWAVWCGPCVGEIGDYNEFFREYKKKGVHFVGLAMDSGTEQEVSEAVKRLKMEYPVSVPNAKELDALGQILVLPTTWIVDANGRIVKEYLGVPPTKHRTMQEIVDRLLTTDY